MMPTGLFSQIALIILSVGIIFTYVIPSLTEIKKTQDTVTIYQTEREKVSEVSLKLDNKASQLNSISAEDQRKLLTYMPDSVDTVAVPRDIKAIADKSGIVLGQIVYEGAEDPISNDLVADPAATVVAQTSYDPEAHAFSVTFVASYDQLKQFLGDLELNAYPLEVHDMSVGTSEEGFLSVEMKIITYDRIVPVAPVDPSQITS
jgi:hypothetical protein